MTQGFNIVSALAKRAEGISSPQRTYLWRLELPDLTQITRSLDITVDRQAFFSNYNIRVPDVNDINNRIKTVSTPYFQTDTDKETIGATSWNYAKTYTIGNIDVELLEYEDGATINYLKCWAALQTMPDLPNIGPDANSQSPNLNTVNPPVYYKFPVRFIRINTLKMDTYVDIYKGCFVGSIGDLSNDYENSGLVSVSVNLMVDFMDSRRYYGDTSDTNTATLLKQSVNIPTQFGALTTDQIRNLVPSVAAQIGI